MQLQAQSSSLGHSRWHSLPPELHLAIVHQTGPDTALVLGQVNRELRQTSALHPQLKMALAWPDPALCDTPRLMARKWAQMPAGEQEAYIRRPYLFRPLDAPCSPTQARSFLTRHLANALPAQAGLVDPQDRPLFLAVHFLKKVREHAEVCVPSSHNDAVEIISDEDILAPHQATYEKPMSAFASLMLGWGASLTTRVDLVYPSLCFAQQSTVEKNLDAFIAHMEQRNRISFFCRQQPTLEHLLVQQPLSCHIDKPWFEQLWTSLESAGALAQDALVDSELCFKLLHRGLKPTTLVAGHRVGIAQTYAAFADALFLTDKEPRLINHRSTTWNVSQCVVWFLLRQNGLAMGQKSTAFSLYDYQTLLFSVRLSQKNTKMRYDLFMGPLPEFAANYRALHTWVTTEVCKIER